jgi:hypothetical protein
MTTGVPPSLPLMVLSIHKLIQTQKITALPNLTLNETLATLPTSTWCKHPRAELKSTVKHPENLKSVMMLLSFLKL